jgi:hypothetical protein
MLAKAKLFLHLEPRVRVGHGPTHLKNSLSLLMFQYSKDARVKKKGGFCEILTMTCLGEHISGIVV